MDDIADAWDTADDILSYTDTDLEFSRLWSSRLYDADGTARHLADALIDAEYVTNYSEAMDMGLRVGVADILDTESTDVQRSEYDIAYMIPPAGWVDENAPLSLTLGEPDEYDERYVQFSAPETVRDITHTLVDAGVADSNKAIILRGLRRLAGV